ncbi:MAG: hypothetical protein HN348_29030, partial [Proteobacteria bacterium]|nr:hypothetical protein [Pseudomonadota bacterium]
MLIFACNKAESDVDKPTPGPSTVDEDGDYVLSTVDCDDQNAAVHPYAEEICDGIDNDCDDDVDEGVEDTWYLDGDGDGLGDAEAMLSACEQPTGYVDNSDDCDDSSDSAPPYCPGDLVGDWPTYGVDAGRTGYYPGVVGNKLLKEAWSKNLRGTP